MTGYIVLAAFAFVFISLAYFVSKKFPSDGVDDFVVAGRSMPFGIIAASVTVSWIWTTSLMGAAESGFWFGISGGVAYALGSFIPFFVFIPLILRLRRIMPRCTTFVEFAEQRYDATLQKIFLLFAIGVALYISFEQMMGIGYAIQLQPQAGCVDVNIAEAEKLIAQAAAAGARLVLLPELWAVGYGIEEPQAYAESFGGKVTAFMREQAPRHGIYVSGGYAEKGEDGRCYDSALLISPHRKMLLNHRKVHLYTALGEDKIWSPGECFDVADTELGKIGILICYDGDFVESWRMLVCQGAELVLHPCAYESPCDNHGWWSKLYDANAINNAVWCVSANIVGDTPDYASHFFGWSRVINPLGHQIATATHVPQGEKGHSELLLADLAFRAGLVQGREINGCLVTDRRPQVYGAPAFASVPPSA